MNVRSFLLAASTGLRQGELFGLKWRDIDFEHGELNVIRSIVCGEIGRCKTESSQKPVPMDAQLATVLMTWKEQCKFRAEDDWVFASRLRNGRRPYWGAAILRKSIRPVVEKLDINKRIGWHTFRHTYCTLLRSLGVEFKVMQELMRHSSLRSTFDVYTQAVGAAKWAAQAAVLSLFFAPTDPENYSRFSGWRSYRISGWLQNIPLPYSFSRSKAARSPIKQKRAAKVIGGKLDAHPIYNLSSIDVNTNSGMPSLPLPFHRTLMFRRSSL